MTLREETMATLYRGGTLFDGHQHRGRGAVLVEGGRIVAVATEAEGDAEATVREAATGPVEVVDLDGGLLAPGFIDAHIHAAQGGLERIRCDLTQASSREGYLDVIRTYAAENPDVEWILGGGWAMAEFPGGTPTAAELDQVVSDRPVFFPNRDHHGAWVNSRALELAGVGARTPDPSDGYAERDADGRPTGTLHEGAMELVGRFVPSTSDEEYDRALMAAQTYLHSVGVTGWQDAILGDYAGITDPSPAYLRAARSGALVSQVVGALWWERDQGVEQLPGLIERRERYAVGALRATTVKIMQDGVLENHTAALETPYLDRCGHATSNSGHSFIEAGALREGVVALADAGFQVHVHAIGDRGVREALDAFEGARDHGPGDLRHHIAHLQVVHPDDVPRFAQLGVAANMQALWACYDDQMVELTIPFLGEERAAWQYPFGDLHRVGAPLAMGSDWPVSPPHPLEAIHVAVNRTAYGVSGVGGERPLLPEQALPLEVAFSAYTAGSARVCHRDDAGVIRPGAVADLVLFDRDPFAGPTGEIGGTQVRATWVAGQQVH